MKFSPCAFQSATKSKEHTRRTRSTLMGRAYESPWRGLVRNGTNSQQQKKDSRRKTEGDVQEEPPAFREAPARGAQARAQGAGPLRRDFRLDAARCGRRPERILISHGRSGHRCDGA